MSTQLYITEFTDIPVVAGRPINLGQLPYNATQNQTVTGSSGLSSALNEATSVVRLHFFDSATTPTGCYVAYDGTATPTAVNTGSTATPRISSGTDVYFYINPLKRGGKFAAITGT